MEILPNKAAVGPALLPLLVILVSALVSGAQGFIPSACITNATRPGINGMCCPRHPTNFQVCGGPGRGRCVQVAPCVENIPEVFLIDDRVAFPSRFFNYTCECEPNFWGPACEECNFNRKGPDCQEERICTRRNVMTLSREEQKQFQRIFYLSYFEKSGYHIVVEDDPAFVDPIDEIQMVEAHVHYLMNCIHKFSSRSTVFNNDNNNQMCSQFGILDFSHGSCAFVPWHRYLTLLWERFFAKIAKKEYGHDDWCMPYWNWIDQADCDVCHDDLACASGEADQYGVRLSRNCPFYNFREYCTEPTETNSQWGECFTCHSSTQFGYLTRQKRQECPLPRQWEVERIMQLTEFTTPNDRDDQQGGGCASFAAAVEGSCKYRTGDDFPATHNLVHVCFDGSMCCGSTANSDILFPLHHCTVDWLVAIWQRTHGSGPQLIPNSGCRPGHHRECYLTGIMPLKRVGELMGTTETYGYNYDSYEVRPTRT